MRLVQAGPRDARIVCVGEAPGGTEESTGIPFSGGAGTVLDSMLGRVGIPRGDCFITNVCHDRPPGNKFDYFIKPKIRPELLQGIMQLKADLEAIRPNVICALGAVPLRFLTGKVGIDAWRGSILPCTLVPGLKVVATYHPAYIMRIWDYKAVAELDIARVKQESLTPELILPQRELIVAPSADVRDAVALEMLRAKWLGCDIENWDEGGGRWPIACVGFSDRPNRSLTIPWTSEENKQCIRMLLESEVPKVFSNGWAWDLPVLADNGVVVRNYKWDTQIGHHTLFPESAGGSDELSAMQGKKRMAAIKKSLAFQTTIYTREPRYKDENKLWKQTGDLEMFWKYNGKDACCTTEIREVEEVEQRAFGVEAVMAHKMELTEPLMKASRMGILIDQDVRNDFRIRYHQEVENLQKFLDQAAGSPINVKSSPHIKQLVYGKLGLPEKLHKKTKNVTADKDALIALAAKYNHPLLLTILEIRRRRDIIERYVDARVDTDGRMRCSFDVTGTRTGRLSSRGYIYGTGTNLQNVPPEMRKMFIADPGKTFVLCDFSQAEARIVAYLARCKSLIELFEDSTRDIHRENASRIFDKPLDQVTSEERELAKKVVHASNYGMGPDRLMEVVNQGTHRTGIRIDLATARMLIERYFWLYPEIKQNFWADVARELRTSRTLIAPPLGDKRQFFGRWDEKLLRDGYSHIPQTTVGRLGTLSIVNCHRAIPWADFMLNVHDSVVMMSPEDRAEECAGIMQQEMKIPLTIHGQHFHVPVDTKIGHNLFDYHEETNPRGMRKMKKAA